MDLIACPWCGCNDEDSLYFGEHIAQIVDLHFVGCKNCGVSGPMAPSQIDAARYWNDRYYEEEES